jgi:hypothetical protein
LADDVIWYAKVGKMDPALSDRVLDSLTAYGQAVSHDELPQLTGLPDFPGGRGSAAANAALQQVGTALNAFGLKAPELEGSGLWRSWRALADDRLERLSMREPLPPPVLAIMLTTALATLVLLGSLPHGNDMTVRWIVSALGGIVIVTVLCGVALLAYPGSKQHARMAPVMSMNEVIATRH